MSTLYLSARAGEPFESPESNGGGVQHPKRSAKSFAGILNEINPDSKNQKFKTDDGDEYEYSYTLTGAAKTKAKDILLQDIIGVQCMKGKVVTDQRA